ncbi:MAG TPA: hypothetical protein VMB51_04585 [Solirubrobacteraceae bacterium]|nr:hypothetical protein [Solirubrobacteraceae bacterium]
MRHLGMSGSGKESHTRMIGVGRLALVVIAALALALIGAASAMAEEEPELSKKMRTKIFGDCPSHNPEAVKIDEEYYEGGSEEIICFTGITSGGKEGGHFTVGAVTVPLSKKITLHGAAAFIFEGNGGEGKIHAAEDGKTLEAPPLAIPKGAKLITPQIMEEAEWPESLKQIYNEKKAKKELGLSATIEVAGGNQIYENRDGLSTENLLFEEGTAFILPLKVKVSGPLLYKLQKGADTCTIGTDEHPVVQHLTTGESVAPPPYEANTQHGSSGELNFSSEFRVIEITNNTLVDSTWPVEIGAEGCGGSYESYVNKAMDILLKLPSPAGASTTELKGNLYSGNFLAVKQSKERHGE